MLAQDKKPQPMMVELLKVLRRSFKVGEKEAIQGKKVVWSNIGILSLFFYAFDLVPFYPQFFMHNSKETLDNLETIEGKFGIANDICTENKIAIARCLMPSNSSIPVPEPNFIVSMNLMCTQSAGSFDFISKQKNIPHHRINIPFIDYQKFMVDQQYKIDLIKYLKRQFDVLTDTIQTKFQVKLDETKLRSAIENYLKSAMLFEHALKLNTNKPAPIDGQSFIGYIQPFVTNYHTGGYDIVKFYISLYNEIRSIVEKNKDLGLKREKIRIYWDGSVFVHKEKVLKNVFSKYGASIVFGSSVAPYLSLERESMQNLPFPLNKENLEEYYRNDDIFLKDRFNISNFDDLSASELLARLFLQLSFFKNGMEYRQAILNQTIKQYDIDAVIIHVNQSCRFWSLPQTRLRDYVCNDLHFPCLSMQADHLDSRCISEAQLMTRIESFLESLSY